MFKKAYCLLLLLSNYSLSHSSDSGNPDKNDNVSQFYDAAGRGDIEAMTLYLDMGISINTVQGGLTALSAAANGNHAAAVRFLMARGADPFVGGLFSPLEEAMLFMAPNKIISALLSNKTAEQLRRKPQMIRQNGLGRYANIFEEALERDPCALVPLLAAQARVTCTYLCNCTRQQAEEN